MNLSEKISLILVDKGFSLSPKKNTEDLINSGTEFHKSNEDIKIAEQHGIAGLKKEEFCGLVPRGILLTLLLR